MNAVGLERCSVESAVLNVAEGPSFIHQDLGDDTVARGRYFASDGRLPASELSIPKASWHAFPDALHPDTYRSIKPAHRFC